MNFWFPWTRYALKYSAHGKHFEFSLGTSFLSRFYRQLTAKLKCLLWLPHTLRVLRHIWSIGIKNSSLETSSSGPSPCFNFTTYLCTCQDSLVIINFQVCIVNMKAVCIIGTKVRCCLELEFLDFWILFYVSP